MGNLEDRVILYVINEVFLPQGRYPENLVVIARLEVLEP